MSGRKKSLVSRRTVLGGAAAVGALPLLRPVRGFAADETIGNYPDGVKGDTVFVGVSSPLTGAYSADGEDHLKGYQLAIEHLNGGGGLVGKIDTLTGKGVLGKKVIYKYGDTQTQPNPAIQG